MVRANEIVSQLAACINHPRFLLELAFQILEPIHHNVDLRRRVQSRRLDHQEALSINTDIEGTVRDAGHAISPVHTLKEFGHLAIVIVDDGREVRVTQTDPGVTLVGNEKKQFSSRP